MTTITNGFHISSRLWSFRSYNNCYAYIEQKASGTVRTVLHYKLPKLETLSEMSDDEFNRVCRNAFHGFVAAFVFVYFL